MPCTTVLVGKKATNDNSTMIARTDDGFFDVKKMVVVEPKKQPRKYKSVLSHVEIELPDNPMRYTSCPSVDKKDGIWAATGINEANVGMTATETITTNPRVLAADPMVMYEKAKKRGEKDLISLVFFGDGTSNEGATWEAMNLAAVWQLPTLFVCVNNTYGMSTPIAQAMKDTDISKRAYPFDMPARSIDGNNVLEVYQTIKEAREYVASGKGPMLVVENTYRISGHSKSDGNLYRTKEEIESWKKKCPIKAFRKYLVENGIATEQELDDMAQAAANAIDAAEEYAKSCPEPSVDDLLNDVYA